MYALQRSTARRCARQSRAMVDHDPLMRLAILTVLRGVAEPIEEEELMRRTVKLLELGKDEVARRAAALKASHRH